MLAEDSSYEAYTASRDFDGDGRADRAFVLLKGDSGKVYWAQGRASGFGAPVLLGESDWATRAGLVTKDRRLLFGKFYSDVASVWAWDPNTRRLELVPHDPEL